jgi:hypothetical protein
MSWYTSGQEDQNIRYWLLDSTHGSYETRRAAIESLSPNYAIANGRVANTKVVTGYATDAEISSNSLDIGGAVLDRVHNYVNQYADTVSIRTNSYGHKHPIWGQFLQQPLAIPTTAIDRLVAWWKNTGSDTVLYISRDGGGDFSGSSYQNAASVAVSLGTGNTIDPSAYTLVVFCGDLFKDLNQGAGTVSQAIKFLTKNGLVGTRTQIMSHPVDEARFIGLRYKGGNTWASIGSGAWELNLGSVGAPGDPNFIAYRSAPGATLRFLTRVLTRADCIATTDTWFGEVDFSGTDDRLVVHLAEGIDPTDTVFKTGGVTLDIVSHSYFDVFGIEFFGCAWKGTDAEILHDMAWYSCIFSHVEIPFGDNSSTYSETTGAFDDKHHYNRTWQGCRFNRCYTGVYDTNSGHSAVPVNTLIRDCYFTLMNRIAADNYGVNHFSASDTHCIGTQGVDGHSIINCRCDDVGNQTFTHYIQPNNFPTPTGGLESEPYYAAMPFPTSCFSHDNEVSYTYPTILRDAYIGYNLITNVRSSGGYATDGQTLALNGDNPQCLMVNGTGTGIVIEYNIVEGADLNDGAMRCMLSYPDGDTEYPIFRFNRVYVDAGTAFRSGNNVVTTHIAGVANAGTYEPSFSATDNYMQSTLRYVHSPNVANPAHHVQIYNRNTYVGGGEWWGPSGSEYDNLADWQAAVAAGDTHDPDSAEQALESDTGSPTLTASGGPTIGSTLTATLGADPDGATSSLSYQWFRNSVLIAGATASTYAATAGNGNTAGDDLSCVVLGKDAKSKWFLVTSNEITLTADASDVDDGDATVAVTGSPIQGGVLAAVFANNDPDGAATGVTYQWQSTGATDIGGATSSMLTLGAIHVGLALRVKVTYTDGEGFSETIYSAYTSAVQPPSDTGSGTPTKARGKKWKVVSLADWLAEHHPDPVIEAVIEGDVKEPPKKDIQAAAVRQIAEIDLARKALVELSRTYDEEVRAEAAVVRKDVAKFISEARRNLREMGESIKKKERQSDEISRSIQRAIINLDDEDVLALLF